MARQFARVGVVGLGTMGAGIAEVLARSGLDVVGVEGDDAALDRARGHLTASTGRALRRGRITQDEVTRLLGRISLTTDLTALVGCELVIEAVPEVLAVKRELFVRLDALLPADAVLATNTSALSVTELAVATRRPGLVVGIHWFNPAPVMGLVEVVRTLLTDPEVVQDVQALVGRAGKTAVTVSDRAGFVANALLLSYLNAAARMYEAGRAGRDDIDAAMRVGCGHPMGPLALLDLIGLDTALHILETLYAQSRDRLHAPAPVLRQYVLAGLLGRKTGRGFYTYDRPHSGTVVPDGPAAREPGLENRPGARPVRTVAVVGAGPRVEGVAQACRDAGYQPAGPAEPADLVLAVDHLPADLLLPHGAVLAAAAGPRSVLEAGLATGRPQDVVGIRWADPVAGPGLVEVAPTVCSAPDAVATVLALCARLGRQPVLCADRAGLVVDALLLPYLNEAVRMLEAGYTGPDDIDAAMTLGCGHPAGPIALLDRIGPDSAVATLRRLHAETGEPGHLPAPLLVSLALAGRGFREATPTRP